MVRPLNRVGAMAAKTKAENRSPLEAVRERIDQIDADRFRECLRAVADEHDMRGFLHHGAREQDRILDAVHAGDRAGAQRRAVHDRGVELVPAVVREHGTQLDPDIVRRGHGVRHRRTGFQMTAESRDVGGGQLGAVGCDRVKIALAGGVGQAREPGQDEAPG